MTKFTRKRATKKPKRYARTKRGAPSKWTNLRSFNNGITDRMTTKLKYFENFRLDSAGSGLLTTRVYRGNSCFDPDFSLGGHAPYFYDQLSILYGQYTVTSSRIIVKAVAIGATTGAVIVIVPTRQTFAGATLISNIELPRSKYRLIENGGPSARIEHVIASNQMIPRWNSNQLALVTANPDEQWFWHILGGSAVTGADSVIDVTVELEYTVSFSEKLNQIQS